MNVYKMRWKTRLKRLVAVYHYKKVHYHSSQKNAWCAKKIVNNGLNNGKRFFQTINRFQFCKYWNQEKSQVCQTSSIVFCLTYHTEQNYLECLQINTLSENYKKVRPARILFPAEKGIAESGAPVSKTEARCRKHHACRHKLTLGNPASRNHCAWQQKLIIDFSMTTFFEKCHRPPFAM